MAVALTFLLLTCVILASLLGPGLLLTRPLPFNPLERLTLAIGFSGILLYFFSFGVYAFALPEYSHYVIAAGCLIALAFSVRDLRRLLSDKSVRVASLCFLFLLGWILLHVTLVRNFSGGGWSGDWFEHYQRALFFLLRLPLDFLFLAHYWLPARPPLQNIVVAHFLSLFGGDFPVYQIVHATVAIFVCLPLFLFAQHAERQFNRVVLLLVFFLALNPMFVHNAVYPWTRHFASFYILSGLYFYWRGYFDDDPIKIGVSLLLLTAAIVVHYSAVPYAICVAGHLLLRFGPVRMLRDKILLSFSAASIFLLLSWVGWSLAQYGSAITFGSNTTVLGAEGHSSIDFIGKFFFNIWNTVVPHWFRHADNQWFEQNSFWGRLRDSVFLVVQTNVVGAVGLTTGLLLLYRTGLDLYRRSFRTSSWRFWAVISVTAILLSIASNDEPDDFGVAHICLQPLVFLGLTYLSVVMWEEKLLFRSLAGIGTFLTYVLGVLIHFVLCSVSFAQNETSLAEASIATRANWLIKARFKVVFMGDLLAPYQNILVAAEILIASFLCIAFIRCCLLVKVAPVTEPPTKLNRASNRGPNTRVKQERATLQPRTQPRR